MKDPVESSHLTRFDAFRVNRGSEWGGGGGLHVVFKISLLCRLLNKIFEFCRLLVNLN